MSTSGIAFPSMARAMRGNCTTGADSSSMHDFHRELANADEDTPIAKYALSMRVRVIARPHINAVASFVMTEGNIDAVFVTTNLLSAIEAVQSYDLQVTLVLFEGSSVNLRAFKDLLGASNWGPALSCVSTPALPNHERYTCPIAYH